MTFPRRPGPVLLLVVGYGLLLLSWAMSNSPGSSPDEPAHLTKALGAATGQFSGKDADYPVTPEFGPAQLPWINSVTRSFEVPRRATFGTIATCNAFQPEKPSTCVDSGLARRGAGYSREKTHTGSYQPAPYLAIGSAARFGGAASGAVRAGRLVVGAVSLYLIALAAASLWSAAWRRWSLVGLMVAVSPMVVFLSASLSPSGMEIAGGIAMSAGALAISRSADPRRLAWVALGAGGTVMALARSTGPVWATALLLLVVALSGVRGTLLRLRAGGAVAGAALVAIALGSLATLAWDMTFMPAPPRSPQPGRLLEAAAHLPELLRQSIGVFGWLDTAMPALAYTAWRVMLIALIGLALLVGTRRERLVLLATTTAVLAATIGLALVAVFPTGFGTQARYTLPIAVAVPLLAGEIVARRRHRLRGVLPAHLPAAFAMTAAAVHFIGWYANGRRHGVGIEGPLWFIGRGEWSPPLGWAAWAFVAMAGVLCLMASAAVDRRVTTAAGSTRRRARRDPKR